MNIVKTFDGSYNVINDFTVINTFKTYEEARNKIRDIKRGIGFLDWEPAFIRIELKKVKK